LFAFHIQPVDPGFPCSVIHVYPAENGKGNPQTVEKLMTLKNELETEFGFAVLGLVFDGDSCFNVVYEEFMRQWKPDLLRDIRFLPSVITNFVIICDPLHLLKRIQYLLVALLQFICPDEHSEFFFP
jgi:hypothetical protein